MTKEELKEFLKTVKDAGFELGDVEVNVITVKDKDAEGSQEEVVDKITDEELEQAAKEAEEVIKKSKPEAAKEPSLEKASEKVAAMIQANIRFAKAMKDAASEFYQLSCLAGEILRDNQELRAKLEEK